MPQRLLLAVLPMTMLLPLEDWTTMPILLSVAVLPEIVLPLESQR